MENLLVATFQNKEDAFGALSKLKDLEEIDDIIIYNVIALEKKKKRFAVLYQNGLDTQDFPATGAFTGSLIGAVGGPIGMAIGMVAGLMIGVVDEDDTEAFFKETLHGINKQINAGSSVLVMNIEEDMTSITDSYLELYHAKVTRTAMSDQYKKYNEEQWAELNGQIDAQEKSLQAAAEVDKAAIKAKIKELKIERQRVQRKFKSNRDNLKKRIQEKLEGLNQKINASNRGAKQKSRHNKKKPRESYKTGSRVDEPEDLLYP